MSSNVTISRPHEEARNDDHSIGLSPEVQTLGCVLLEEVPVDGMLGRVLETALLAAPVAALAAVSRPDTRGTGRLVCTHPAAELLERLQRELGSGPSVAALRSGRAVVIDDVAGPGPFAEFRAHALSVGVRSSMALALRAEARVEAVVSVYAVEPGRFGPAAVERVRSFAHIAGFALANHQAYWDARLLAEHLQQAMVSRSTIEQAKGIVAARVRCTTDEAFEMLRRHSQQRNVKVRELADEVIRQATRQTRISDGRSRPGR